MKVLIVSQYFWPENFRINDLSNELINRGYEVDVITGQPNYPEGKFYDGYSFRYSNQKYNNINIFRIPIIPRGNNYLMLSLNYISFAVLGSIYALFKKKKYDKIFAVNYSPITAVIPAIIIKIKHNTKLFLWVQDLWPESINVVTKINFFGVNYILNKIVKSIYFYSDKILVSNKGFSKSILKKGVKENKIEFMPNWAEDLFEKVNKIKIKKYQHLIPPGFVVMFAGNMGIAQDLENVLNAIELTNDKIKWVFLGKGRKLKWFSNKIKEKKLSSRVKILGVYSLDEMPNFFCHADLTLVSLTNDYIFSLTTPGKVQSYMASGKPIVTMLNGEGNSIIKDANCGFCANASDYKKLAVNIMNASNLSSQKLKEYGNNGRKYYETNFKKKIIIDKFCDLLSE